MYEINVSHKDVGHIFATSTRSLPSWEQALKVRSLILKAFPSSKGYEVSLYKITTESEKIQFKREVRRRVRS